MAQENILQDAGGEQDAKARLTATINQIKQHKVLIDNAKLQSEFTAEILVPYRDALNDWKNDIIDQREGELNKWAELLDELIQSMRLALIQLNLAISEFEEKGRTPEYYKYLFEIVKHLEQVIYKKIP